MSTENHDFIVLRAVSDDLVVRDGSVAMGRAARHLAQEVWKYDSKLDAPVEAAYRHLLTALRSFEAVGCEVVEAGSE